MLGSQLVGAAVSRTKMGDHEPEFGTYIRRDSVSDRHNPQLHD
jgi:hypothetical protein